MLVKYNRHHQDIMEFWFKDYADDIFVLDNEELAFDKLYSSNSLRVKNNENLEKIINEKFLNFSREEIIKKCN